MVRRIGGPADRGSWGARTAMPICPADAGNGAATTATRTGADWAAVACGVASSCRAGPGVTEQHARSPACRRVGCGASSRFGQQQDFIAASGAQPSSRSACALPDPSKPAADTAATIRVDTAKRIVAI